MQLKKNAFVNNDKKQSLIYKSYKCFNICLSGGIGNGNYIFIKVLLKQTNKNGLWCHLGTTHFSDHKEVC